MRVLITEPAHTAYGSQLEREGIEWLIMRLDGSLSTVEGAEVAARQSNVDVAWGTSDLFREGAPLAAFFSLMLKSPTLRWFQSPAAGYDDAVFASLVAHGVRVTNAHVNSLPIAEFVMRSVLEEFQEAWKWRDQLPARGWQIHDWREVSATTWVIVGLGGIGTEVALRARAFGAEIIGCRRHPSPDDPTDRTVLPEELLDVVELADVIVLAAPATAETTNLVDATFLARMKQGSLLVNVARGTLIDDDALLAALDSGQHEAAHPPVFREDPLPHAQPSRTHPRVRTTPHNPAGGVGRLRRQADLFSENLGRYMRQQPLLNDVTDAIGGEQ